MTSRRLIALLIGGGRMAIGAPLAVSPGMAAIWVPDASRRGAQPLVRGLAGRDVALGAGLVAAVLRDEGVPLWLAAGAAADAADFVGTALAGGALPARPRAATMAVAGGAAVVGAAMAAVWTR